MPSSSSDSITCRRSFLAATGGCEPKTTVHWLNTAPEKELQVNWFKLTDAVEPIELLFRYSTLLITGFIEVLPDDLALII